MGLDNDIAFFEQVPMFAALDREALRILAIGAETKQLQHGAVLFYAGELADGGYLVQQGSLQLEPGMHGEGKAIIAGPGTLIGELALLTDTVCQATAITEADQCAGADDDLVAFRQGAGLQEQRTFLQEIAAIGELAGIEQHGAVRQLLGFRADSEDAQCLLVERREDRHLFEEGDVVIEAHG